MGELTEISDSGLSVDESEEIEGAETPSDDASVEEQQLPEADASDTLATDDSVDVSTSDDDASEASDGGATVTDGVNADDSTDQESELSLLAQASEDDLIASGVSGTCSWSIDADGLLRIWATDGQSGQLANQDEVSATTAPWFPYRSSITSVVFERGTRLPVISAHLFCECTSLTSIDATGWDVSEVTNMEGLFCDCSSLTSLNLSGWDTSRVTNMNGVFEGCTLLNTVNLTGWDTTSVTSMRYLFGGCSSVPALDLSGWETSSVTNMYNTFRGCSSLESLDLSGWDTSAVTIMLDMFSDCWKLKYFAVDGFEPTDESGSFPERSDGWWSTADQTWYTTDQIKNDRSGVADVYTDGAMTTVTSLDIQLSEASYVYDGAAHEPAPEVTSDGSVLVPGTDYEVSYEDNVNVGTATVVVTGKGEYQGVYRKDFEIEPRPVKIAVANATKAYGDPDPEFKTSVEGLVEGDETAFEYVLTREPGEELGTYAITASGDELQGNYQVTFTPGTLTIEKASIADATIAPIPAQAATGAALEPQPEVTMGDRTLVPGTDYTVSYRDNKAAGAATVIVRGTGNYTGETTATFRIGSKSIADCDVTLARDLFLARELPAKPGVYAYEPEDYESLTRGVDYEVTYANNTGVSEATAIVTGLGDYVGAVELPYLIVEAIDLSDEDTVSLWAEPFARIYRYGAVKPAITISYGGGSVRLVEGQDCTIEYYNNDRPGLATAVIKGMGSFMGTATVSFRLLDPSEIDLAGADSYLSAIFDEPLFWFASDEDSAPVYLWRDGEQFPEPDLQLRNSDMALGCGYSLERGVDYEIRYHQFEENDEVISAAAMVVGIDPVRGVKAYSYLVQRRVNIGMMNLDSSWLEQPEYRYEGEAVTPKLRTRPDFVEGVDYELEYLENTGVGTCKVLVIGMGQFYGTDTIEVPIVASYSAPDLADCTVELEPDQWLTYTGYPMTPKVRVTDPKTGGVLREDSDYTLAYENNVNVGEATITVLPCTKWFDTSYQGRTSTTFTIKPADVSQLACGEVIGARYTGHPLTPRVTVSDPITDAELVYGDDFELSYADNTSVGTATIIITGKGNYTGTLTTTFDIGKATQTVTPAKTAYSLAMGKTLQLDATASAGGELSYEVTSGEAYAKVSATGKVTPVKVGTATMTVTAAATDTHEAATTTIKVTVGKGTPTITATNKEVVTGKTVSLGAKVTKGAGALSYKSANTKVATVSSKGVVKGVKAGSAKITITAKANGNWKAATKTITVKVGKANPLTAKAKKSSVTASFKTLKSKAVTLVSNITVGKAQGKVTYANASSNATAKKFKVNATSGKITVPKGTKKGTYVVKITAKAAGNSTYISGTKTVSFKVVVK